MSKQSASPPHHSSTGPNIFFSLDPPTAVEENTLFMNVYLKAVYTKCLCNCMCNNYIFKEWVHRNKLCNRLNWPLTTFDFVYPHNKFLCSVQSTNHSYSVDLNINYEITCLVCTYFVAYRVDPTKLKFNRPIKAIEVNNGLDSDGLVFERVELTRTDKGIRYVKRNKETLLSRDEFNTLPIINIY